MIGRPCDGLSPARRPESLGPPTGTRQIAALAPGQQREEEIHGGHLSGLTGTHRPWGILNGCMPLKRVLPLVIASAILASQAVATWSIVVVNRRTGEVCIASATCLENFNLRSGIGVVAAEVGVGATQSYAVPAFTRKRIHDLMLEGVPPQEILDIISIGDTLWPARQIGLVDMAGRAVSYSGANCGGWFGGVIGEQGDYVYAIQGNVLTGVPVVTQCESAFLATSGDLGQKVMAAMEAAMLMGGDGRCSCTTGGPQSCGSPPPNFNKSAHVAFFVIARPGEAEICTNSGCAGGDFYLAINKSTQTAADPDPVLLMRQDFDAWRLALQGRPDAVRSGVWPEHARVASAGGAPISFELDLSDVDGQPVQQGGAAISLIHDPRSAGIASLGQVFDHNDGTYTVEVLPGSGVGTDLLRFRVDDGIRAIQLWPPVRVLHDPGSSAPLLRAQPPAGIAGIGAPRAVHLSADRLNAWLIADSGGLTQLFTAARPQPDADFGPPTAVALSGLPLERVTDLVVSADGLRLLLSVDVGGVSRLWSSARASTAAGFDAPLLLADLDSGAGDAHPALSADERGLVFASRRDGSWDLWRARRLTPTARFFPPEKISELSTPFQDEFSPQYDEGDARLWFESRSGGGAALLMTAALQADGAYSPASAAPGVYGGQERLLVAVEAGEGPVWFLASSPGGRLVAAQARANASLSADAETLSAVAGGVVQFTLDAGPAWAGAAYRLTLGDPGVTVLGGAGIVLPFDRNSRFDAWLRDPANAALLPGFAGALDLQGRSSAQWILPAGRLANSALIGRSFAIAYVAARAGERFLSEEVPILLTN